MPKLHSRTRSHANGRRIEYSEGDREVSWGVKATSASATLHGESGERETWLPGPMKDKYSHNIIIEKKGPL